MNILFIHTRYRFSGGEDLVFTNECALMDDRVNIYKYVLRNRDGLLGAFQFLFSIWNIFTSFKIMYLIKFNKIDIIHLHNWHYASGPLIIRTTKKQGVSVVLTFHNYRLLCPSATFLHQGNLFTSSLHSTFPWTAVRNKVYRHSSLQTFWVAFVVWFHKRIGTWNMVDRYIVLTEFSRNLFINSSLGVPSQKFIVKPNFVLAPPDTTQLRGDSFLFIGRLSEEKGIETLLEAFRQTGLPLRIAGSGPLEDTVLKAVSEVPTIQYLGMLDKYAIQRELSVCTALVFPSIWYEGMPMTILEAFASDTPVIASNLGAMASMIQSGQNGVHFEAGNAAALVKVLHQWHNLPENDKATYRQNARSTYEAQYTPEINREQLLSIYQQVIDEKKAS